VSYFAAKLGVANVFDAQPKTIAQLIAETNTKSRSLYRRKTLPYKSASPAKVIRRNHLSA
jgi:hypothetical protein